MGMHRKWMPVILLCSWIVITVAFGQGPVYTEDRLAAERLGPVTEKIDRTQYKNIFHISATTGSDKRGDGSKEEPWQTIGRGLMHTVGSTSKSRSALCVAAGDYAENTIAMQPHVDLYGGFESRTWTRDIIKHRTILDGERVRRVVKAADSARIDGFVITGGLAVSHGGGILCDDSSPEISNNIIRDNTVLGPAAFNHTRIHQEGIQGGGIACRYNALPVIRNNIITGNRTAIGNGAGIAFYGWVRKAGMPEYKTVENRLAGAHRAKVLNNVIIFNRAGINDLHRTRSSNGGGISVGFEARPLIQNNLIAMNDAGGRGDAGGIYIEYFADPDIIGNWVLGNTSDDDGGGLYTMRLGQPLIEGNIFSGNYTRSGGAGAIRLSKEGRATIVFNLITENRGGGVIAVDSYLELRSNIIARNTGRPGVSIQNKFTYFRPSAVIDNILFDNAEGNLDLRDAPDLIFEGNQEGSGQLNVIKTKPLVLNESRFDTLNCITRIVTDSTEPLSEELTGTVVHIGNNWSLVKSVSGKDLIVWGDITPGVEEKAMIEVLPLYQVTNEE